MGRHKFCALIALAILWSGRSESGQATVVIIGGGAAGIAAAALLRSKGVDFLLLEASSRVGGRVRETQFGGWTTELGAQWIHGPRTIKGNENNPVWDYKVKFGLQGSFTNYEHAKFLTRSGRLICQAIVDKWEKRSEEAEHYCLNRNEELWVFAQEQNLSSPENTIDISFKQCWKESGYRKGTLSDDDQAVADTFDWLLTDFEYTPRPKWISTLRGLPTNGPYVDKDFLVTDQRGYSVFLREVAKPFMSVVKLGHRVSDVAYSDSGVTVTTSDGSKYTANAAISTLPLGVMQHGAVKWNPAFPAEKLHGIDGMKMGDYAKVKLQFAENFWAVKEETLMIAGEPLGFMTWGINLDHPKLLPGSKTLEFHFAGHIARRVETQPVSETQAEIMVKLRAMFGQSTPDPLHIFVTNWTHNPLTYGSYSWWPMNYTGEQWEAMKRPEGRLFFAGEHTSDNYGFLHAALDSGEEAAKAVYKVLKASGDLCTKRTTMRFSTTTRTATQAPDGGTCSENHEDCRQTKCCRTKGFKCYKKNEHWAACKDSCSPGINPYDPVQYRTKWRCKVIGAGATQLFDKGPSAAPPDLARSPQAPLPSLLASAAVVASISLLGVFLWRRGHIQGGWQTMEEGAAADAALPLVSPHETEIAPVQ